MTNLLRTEIFFIKISVLILGFSSCSDKVNKDDIYTFKKETVNAYIHSNPDLSMYAKCVDIAHYSTKSNTTVATLLSTVGNYTVFAPNNEAITIYLDSLYGKDNYIIDTLPKSVINRIVLSTIINQKNNGSTKNVGILLSKLYSGTLNEASINGNHFIVRFGDYTDKYSVILNNLARIIKGDLQFYNGIIHIIDRVPPSSENFISTLLGKTKNMKIFSKLLEITSWQDSLIEYIDNNYVPPTSSNNNFPYPDYKIYGYTIFAEPDSIFAKDWGTPMPVINNEDGHIENWNTIFNIILKKCQSIYPNFNNSDYTNSQNCINNFISYHIVDMKMCYTALVKHGGEYGNSANSVLTRTIDLSKYYKTIGTNRLLKITQKAIDGNTYINRHCYVNNAFDGNYRESSCDNEGALISPNNGQIDDNIAGNGYFFPISTILSYTNYTKNTTLNERIRYNIFDFLPEMQNLLMQNYDQDTFHDQWFYTIPHNYCRNLSMNFDARVGKVTQRIDLNYMASPTVSSVCPDLTLKLLPVPHSGNWEIRIPVNHTAGYRSVMFFLGTSPNVREMKQITEVSADNPTQSVDHYDNMTPFYVFTEGLRAFRPDSYFNNDSILCIENDKALRENNYMKGPNCIRSCRNLVNGVRIILYRGYLDCNTTYYLRIQSLLPNSTQLNYIELAPESIYANPSRAEDIW